jgi:hypothetical protein
MTDNRLSRDCQISGVGGEECKQGVGSFISSGVLPGGVAGKSAFFDYYFGSTVSFSGAAEIARIRAAG